MVPYYLAMGSVVVEAGSNAGPYHVYEMKLPAPSEDGRGGFNPAVRGFRVRVTGANPGAVSDSVAALRRQCVRDSLITFQSATGRAILTSRIREANVVETDFDPLDRSVPTGPKMYLILTLTTDPHWLAPWSSETTASLTTVPGTFTIADPGGEDDALVSMRAIASASARGLFLGGMPDAAAGFDPIDDYGASGAGTSDANALTGYKVASSALTATMAAVGTAPAFDTNANRGTYIPIVRMDSNAASVATTAYRVVQRVTGSAISASTDVATASVTPRAIDLVATELERISVPSGAVPDVATGSGYAVVTEGNAVDDGTLTLSTGTTGNTVQMKQTFAGFDGEIVSVTYTIDVAFAAPHSSRNYLVVYDDSDAIISTVAGIPYTAGTHTVSLPIPVACEAGTTYAFSLIFESATSVGVSVSMGMAYSNGDYPAGTFTTPIGLGGLIYDDLTFTVTGRSLLGFNSYSIVQATDTAAASKIANLDYLVRIPVDYAALAYRLSTSAAPALYYDGDTDVAYIADADGIGPAVLDKAEVIKPLRAKPGVSTTYVLATTHDDAAVGTASVTYKTRARYLSATG